MTPTPSNVVIQQVDSPSEKLFENILTLFIDLTQDDPSTLALSGNDHAVRPILLRSWLRDAVAIGQLWTATEGDDLVAFMMWTPPGAAERLPKEEREKFEQPLMDALSKEGLEYYLNCYAKEFPGYVSECLKPLDFSSVWWLRMAMVRRDRQRRGIARALISAVHEKVSATGQYIACSTTTAPNAEFYKKIGFELLGIREMVSPWFNWNMWVFRLVPKPSS